MNAAVACLLRPYPGAKDRMRKERHVHSAINDFYAQMVQSHDMPFVRAAFAERFPTTALTDVKTSDFVLWQTRT